VLFSLPFTRGKHVQKVIQLLEGMCDDTTIEKTRTIEEANKKIDMLKADIEKYISDSAMLTKEIAGHDNDIAAWTGDVKAASRVRAMEKTDYDATHKNYSESINALERAIAVKEQAHNRKQASFAQLKELNSLELIPKEAKKAINAFLEQDPVEGLAVSAPEACGYEFQS